MPIKVRPTGPRAVFYQDVKSFFVVRGSFCLIVVLFIYYAVVFFHINSMEVYSLAFIDSATFIHYLGIYFLLLIFGLFSKFGVALYGARGNVVPFVITSSIFIIGFYSLLLGVILAAKYGATLISSDYIQRAHMFWIGVFLFLIFSYFGFCFYKFGMITWDTLNDIKSIPIVSPAFCFGAPALFAKNISPYIIDTGTFHIYVAILFTSGGLFLFFLALYYFHNSTAKNTISDINIPRKAIIVGFDKEVIVPKLAYILRITKALFIIFSVALFMLIFVILDMTFYVTFLT